MTCQMIIVLISSYVPVKARYSHFTLSLRGMSVRPTLGSISHISTPIPIPKEISLPRCDIQSLTCSCAHQGHFATFTTQSGSASASAPTNKYKLCCDVIWREKQTVSLYTLYPSCLIYLRTNQCWGPILNMFMHGSMMKNLYIMWYGWLSRASVEMSGNIIMFAYLENRSLSSSSSSYVHIIESSPPNNNGASVRSCLLLHFVHYHSVLQQHFPTFHRPLLSLHPYHVYVGFRIERASCRFGQFNRYYRVNANFQLNANRLIGYYWSNRVFKASPRFLSSPVWLHKCGEFYFLE